MSGRERLAVDALRRMAERVPPAEDAVRREERRARLVGRLERFHGEQLSQPRGRRRVAPWLLVAAALVASAAMAAALDGQRQASSLGTPPRVEAPTGGGLVGRGDDVRAAPPSPPKAAEGRQPESVTPASATPQVTPRPVARSPDAPDPARAVVAPRSTASSTPGSSLPEQNALLLGALRARRSGDHASALAQLDALLAKFPHGAVSQEAEIERFRALKHLGRGAEAARAARRYLSRYPSGVAAEEARGLALGGLGGAGAAGGS